MGPEKKSNKSFFSISSGGQATLEYILLLVVTVGLVLAFSKRFSRPYGEYVNSYFGGYLACLLDKGVLPKLGSGDDACADSFKLSKDNPFAPKSGQKGSDQDKANAGAKNQPSEMSEMANSRSGGGAGRNYGHFSGRRDGAQAGDGAAKNDKVTSIPNPNAESKFFRVSRYGAAGSGPGKIIHINGLTGLLDSERERLKKREERVSRLGTVEGDETSGRGKRMVIKPPVRKAAAEEEAAPMTFGKFVRFFVIIAILLAIIVFLGTQANQISKSWEK